MKTNKKQVYYYVDPSLFNPNKKNSLGAIKKLNEKISYFKFMGIDAVVIKNLFNDKDSTFNDVSSNIGTNGDFYKFIDNAKKNEIKVYIEVSIGSIKDNHIWFKKFIDKSENEDLILTFNDDIEIEEEKLDQTMEVKFNSKTREYYLLNNKTHEVPLNWKNEKIVNKFKEVVSFWEDKNIDGIVISNFEYLNDFYKSEIMNQQTTDTLIKLIKSIREDSELEFIGMSDIITPKRIKELIYSHQVFDLFIASNFSLMHHDEKYEWRKFNDVSIRDLYKKLKELNDKKIIICQDGNNSGRFINKVIDSYAYQPVVAKLLIILFGTLESPLMIYMGNELGMVNDQKRKVLEFNDEDLNKESIAIRTNKEIHEKFISSINKNYYKHMEQDFNFKDISKKNLQNIEYINTNTSVESQYNDKHSVLYFYKNLIGFIKSPLFTNVYNKGEIKIKIKANNLIVISGSFIDNGFEIPINLSQKKKRASLVFKLRGKKHFYLSNHILANNKKIPKQLNEYECIIIVNRI